MSRVGRIGPNAIAVLAISLASRSSPAYATDGERAQQLFDEGLTALDHHDSTTACSKFRQSMDAEPSVGALLNVAACSAQEGKLARAADEYRRVLSMNEATRDAKRRAAVDAETRAALRALQPRVPSVVVQVRPMPAALTVEIDSVPLDRLRLGTAIDLDPGEHQVRVTAPGFEQAERRVQLQESDRSVVEIDLQQTLIPGSRPAGLSIVPGFVLGGVGIAVLAVGGALLGAASIKASEIEDLCGEGAAPPRCDPPSNAAAANDLSGTGSTLEIGGWVAVGVGGAALSAGAALLVFSLTNASSDVSLATMTFAAWGPAGPGGRLQVRF